MSYPGLNPAGTKCIQTGRSAFVKQGVLKIYILYFNDLEEGLVCILSPIGLCAENLKLARNSEVFLQFKVCAVRDDMISCWKNNFNEFGFNSARLGF